MKSIYSITWIDDNGDWMESAARHERQFTDHVSAEGFEPEIRKIIVEGEPPDLESNRSDLLLIDFQLALDQGDGSELIRRLRAINLDTEVIFYSQSGPDVLHDAIAQKRLEGIFVSDREGLFTKATAVFNRAVRMVVDVENMRGLVVAGIARIDHLLTSIIGKKHAVLESDAQLALRHRIVGSLLPKVEWLAKYRENMPEEIVTNLRALLAEIQELKPAELAAILEEQTFSSMRRAEVVIGLCRDHDYLKGHYEDLKPITELLHWRNALAHSLPEPDGDGGYVFRVMKKQRGFNVAEARHLRQEIKRIHDLLTAIEQAVDASSRRSNPRAVALHGDKADGIV